MPKKISQCLTLSTPSLVFSFVRKIGKLVRSLTIRFFLKSWIMSTLLTLQGPYRHYVLNAIWILINLLCNMLTIFHLRKLYIDYTKTNIEALRVHRLFSVSINREKQARSIKLSRNNNRKFENVFRTAKICFLSHLLRVWKFRDTLRILRQTELPGLKCIW